MGRQSYAGEVAGECRTEVQHPHGTDGVAVLAQQAYLSALNT